MEAGRDTCLVFLDVKYFTFDTSPHQLLMEKLWLCKPKPGGYVAILWTGNTRSYDWNQRPSQWSQVHHRVNTWPLITNNNMKTILQKPPWYNYCGVLIFILRYDNINILIVPTICQYLGKPSVHQQLVASRQAEHLPAPRHVAYSPEMLTH